MKRSFHEQESRVAKELALLLDEIRRSGARVVLIGAYAVMSHATRLRDTQDIDFLCAKDQEDLILNVVRNLGYSVNESEELFYVATKPLPGGGEFRIDIMIGHVVDKHHGISYDCPLNEQSRELSLGARALKVTVPSLEDLLLMKLISLRPQDKVDVMSIILERCQDLDFKSYKMKATDADIYIHIRKRITQLAFELKQGLLDELWTQYYASKLLDAQKEKIRGALKKLEL